MAQHDHNTPMQTLKALSFRVQQKGLSLIQLFIPHRHGRAQPACAAGCALPSQ